MTTTRSSLPPSPSSSPASTSSPSPASTSSPSPSSPSTSAPELATVATKVAHDMRGAVGVLRSVFAELEHDTAHQDLHQRAAHARLIHMAARATAKLERTITSLEAVANRHRQAAADVDLEPMLRAAAARTAEIERRLDVDVTLPTPPRPTRVRVVASSLGPVLDDVFRWSLRQASAVVVTTVPGDGLVDVRVDVSLSSSSSSSSPWAPSPSSPSSSSSPPQTQTPSTSSSLLPAAQVPFQDPLGLAALLLAEMGGALAVHGEPGSVRISLALPVGGRS